jgi:hypothetical protein
MADPKILDFSAPEEDVLTIVFPDGVTTCELPTVDELSMSALQFLTSSGDEWYRLFEKAALTVKERQRFEHLNERCIRALCAGVAEDQIKALSVRQKAKVIVAFMTASPALAEQIRATIGAGQTSTTES